MISRVCTVGTQIGLSMTPLFRIFVVFFLYVIDFFFLAIFMIFSLSLVFSNQTSGVCVCVCVYGI